MMDDEITIAGVVALLTQLAAVQMERDEERARADAAEAEREALATENLDLIAEIVQTNCRDYGKGEYQTQSLVDQDLIDRLVTAGRMRHKRDDNKGRAVYEFVPAPPQE